MCRGERKHFQIPSATLIGAPQTVYNAIKSGYRLFDGAGDYGNEKEAGEGIKKAIDDGLVKREELCKLSLHPSTKTITLIIASSSYHLQALEHLPLQGACKGAR